MKRTLWLLPIFSLVLVACRGNNADDASDAGAPSAKKLKAIAESNGKLVGPCKGPFEDVTITINITRVYDERIWGESTVMGNTRRHSGTILLARLGTQVTKATSYLLSVRERAIRPMMANFP